MAEQAINDLNKKKQRLGLTGIADSLPGMLGDAVRSLTGRTKDPKTGEVKKSRRQQMLDDI